MVRRMKEGTVLALMTALLWGITPVMDKIGVAKATPAAVMVVRFTTTFVCILPLVMVPRIRQEVAALDRRTLLYIIGAAVLSAIIGIYFYFWAMTKMDASRVTPICATYPMLTFLLGWMFLHEPITWTKTVGTVLTVIGVVLVSL